MKSLAVICYCLFIFNGCNSNDNFRLFNFNYTIELESSKGKKIELWIPIPQSNEVQNISNLIIDSDGLSYEIKDEKNHNNKYLYVYSNLGTDNDKVITISFNVKRYEHKNIKYKDVDPSSYLKASSLVPIGSAFNTIIKDNNLEKDNMRGVYDFVLSGMHYGKPKSQDNQYYNDPWLSSDGKYGIKKVSRDKVVELYKTAKASNGSYTFGNGNAKYACDIGVGNCTDYHSYFMSLSRTLNTPSRFHMGFPIGSDDQGKVGGYHCWADYYIKGEGWYPVDISEADKDSNKVDYFFGTIDESRVEMMIGRDFDLEGYEGGITNLFIYPLLEINDKKSSKFSKKFSYKNL
jgi:hypothetical protein